MLTLTRNTDSALDHRRWQKSEELYAEGQDHYASSQLYNDAEYSAQEAKKAFSCFQKAAGLGSVKARVMMAKFLLNGYGIQKDVGLAARIFTDLAQRGIAPAQHNLAYCYQKGYGVEQNPKLAKKFYIQAALTNAKANNAAQAVKSLNVAMHLGSIKAKVMLAVVLLNRTESRGNAIRMLQALALKRIASAQYTLARCYEEGHGVEKSQLLATVYYLAAGVNYQSKFCRKVVTQIYF